MTVDDVKPYYRGPDFKEVVKEDPTENLFKMDKHLVQRLQLNKLTKTQEVLQQVDYRLSSVYVSEKMRDFNTPIPSLKPFVRSPDGEKINVPEAMDFSTFKDKINYWKLDSLLLLVDGMLDRSRQENRDYVDFPVKRAIFD